MDNREKDLIERVLNGDSAAFEPLVAPYRGALIGLASRIVWNPEDAKEAAQEALLKAFRYLRSCDPELGFRNWLYQIVVNTARGFRRRQSDAERGIAGMMQALDGSPAAGRPEAHREKSEDRARLRACLDALSPRDRDVFRLRDIEELSVEETARVLSCSSISVRVHLNRARAKVRDRFKARYPGLIGEGR
jgi:RNA polymerase sigma-70 factor (ECF subfamily)